MIHNQPGLGTLPLPSIAQTVEEKVALDWAPKHSILGGIFEVVESVGACGGMGQVYWVRNPLRPEFEFAVKRSKSLSTEERRWFLNEFLAWVDLPKHDHIVTCQFFRTESGEALIFSKYISGGSLLSWLEKADEPPTLANLLDAAIQLAWGLHAGHLGGVIHKDVKPANALRTSDGRVLVTDFGISEVRRFLFHPAGRSEVEEGLKLRAYTPEYASPEQVKGKALSIKTDVWSWGVTVLQLFTRKAKWYGPDVGEALRHYRPSPGWPEMPLQVRKVLWKCFERDPKRRWKSLLKVADALIATYPAQEPYTRSRPAFGPEASRDSATDQGRRAKRWRNARSWVEWALTLACQDAAEADKFLLSNGVSDHGQAVSDLAGYEEADRILVGAMEAAAGEDQMSEERADLLFEKAHIHLCLGDEPGAISVFKQLAIVHFGLRGRGEYLNTWI